jgi:prepilin-type N-terminal cleavage/methylation domain-containing protein/prepilin-type processing-associated H-X9-DG protein
VHSTQPSYSDPAATVPEPFAGRREAGPRGFSLVELLAAVSIIATLIGLVLPSVQRARESARLASCGNNLKNQGLAIGGYEASRRCFPAGNDQGAARFHAWSSFILPFIENSGVSDRIDYRKPWDDAGGNATLADLTLPLYVCPSGVSAFPGKQDYGGILGAWIEADGSFPTAADWERSGVLYATNERFPRPATAAGVTDGLSHTLLVSEGVDRDHTGADQHAFGDSCWACGSNCFALTSTIINNPTRDGFRSRHVAGLQGLFADGHVAFLNDSLAAEVLVALCTKSRGDRGMTTF